MKQRPRLLLAAFTGLCLALPAAAPAARAEPAPTVIELYTSEGCSSCPPADALLAELAEEDDVVALSFHVTYWDRLGWPDPFATQWGTDRQRAYAQVMMSRYVYTPQMVVDGWQDVTGSHPREVTEAIDRSRRTADSRIALPLSRLAADHLAATLPAPPPAAAETGRVHLLLVAFDTSQAMAVKRGENAGRQLSHAHVVRSLRDLGPWPADKRHLDIPLTAAEQSRGLALLAQVRVGDGLPGEIVAAGMSRTP